MKAKHYLLAVLAIVLVFCTARIMWTIAAVHTASNFTTLINGINTGSDFVATMDTFDKYLNTTAALAHTCGFVAKCTPSETGNALYLVKLERARILGFRALYATALEIQKVSQTSDGIGLEDLKTKYYSQRNAIQAIGQYITGALGESPSCDDLNAIFKATL